MRRPSKEELDILRWVTTAALAVVYMFTGFWPALVVGVIVLWLPGLIKVGSSFRDGLRGPR